MRTDPDLAADAAKGNSAAFEELVRRHQATVRGLARRLSGQYAMGDDIAQLTFLTAWRRLSTYAGGTFKSWLCTIAYREFLQMKRKQRPEVEFKESAHVIEFDRSAAHVETQLDLARAMNSLKDEQRICVSLCVAAGLSHREAALITGWPLGTVKSHVNRGVAKMRTYLGEEQVA